MSRPKQGRCQLREERRAGCLAKGFELFDADLALGALGHASQLVERIAASFRPHLIEALVELADVDATGTLSGIQIFLPVSANPREAILR